jgi:hypothetical protein
MKLDKNSNTARLYRWFYGKDSMPNNLCPYFWKVVASYALALPVFLFTIPSSIVYRKGEDKVKLKTTEKILPSLILWGIAYAALSMVSVSAFFFMTSKEIENTVLLFSMVITGISLWFLLILGGFIYLVYLLVKKALDWNWERDFRNLGKGKKPRVNLVSEFIKAKYNKYCPKIDWE